MDNYQKVKNNSYLKFSRSQSSKISIITAGILYSTVPVYFTSMFKMPKRLLGKIIDIDANLLHPDLINNFQYHVDNSLKRDIEMFVVPGSTLDDSMKSIELSQTNPSRFIATAGIHPYNTESIPYSQETQQALENLIQIASTSETSATSGTSHECLDDDGGEYEYNVTTNTTHIQSVRCVGECGLDYTEGFPSKEIQLPWFRLAI